MPDPLLERAFLELEPNIEVLVTQARARGLSSEPLAVLCEVLAGGLTGGGCSNPENADRVVNGMLSIILDVPRFQGEDAFRIEIQRFVAWVKSSAKATPDSRPITTR